MLDSDQNMMVSPKNNNGLVMLIVFLILIIIGLSVYLVLDKSKKSDNKDNEETNSIEKFIDGPISFNDCNQDVCKYLMKIDGKRVEVTYQMRESESEIHRILFNDNKVSENKNLLCGGPNTLAVLKDTVIISYHDGCDVSGNKVAAYDLDGKQLFNYQFLDSNIPNMEVSIEIPEYFKINGDIITIKGTRMSHGSILLSDNGVNQDVYICDKELLESNGINNETIVEGEYQITYNGQGKFSKPFLTQKTTFGEYFKEDMCQQ